MGIALLARARDCTARYNHVMLFMTREQLDEYAASNNWSKLHENERKKKGGLAIYYNCPMLIKKGERCKHKMMAIQRPEGCFVAKTTDGGKDHKHRARKLETAYNQPPTADLSDGGSNLLSSVTNDHTETNEAEPQIQEDIVTSDHFDRACSMDVHERDHADTIVDQTQNTRQPSLMEEVDNALRAFWSDEVTFLKESESMLEPVTPRIPSARKSQRVINESRAALSPRLMSPDDKVTMDRSDSWMTVNETLESEKRTSKYRLFEHDHASTPSQNYHNKIRLSSTKPHGRRSLQPLPYSSHRASKYKRRSCPEDIFEGVSKKLLKRVKSMKNGFEETNNKSEDMEQIAIKLFSSMNSRRQSQLLKICS